MRTLHALIIALGLVAAAIATATLGAQSSRLSRQYFCNDFESTGFHWQIQAGAWPGLVLWYSAEIEHPDGSRTLRVCREAIVQLD
jgi:hypothetical protein